MVPVVEFRVRVPVSYTQRADRVLASCKLLDVHTQGRDQAEAERNIIEAVQLFIETCFEMGTLEQVLKDCGLVPGRAHNRPPRRGRAPEQQPYLDVPLPLVAAKHAAAHTY
jgi:predicted RNase H-like HicB family nuclease